MVADPIAALEALGYTEREASFLYLVASHSGYFLRRQFDYFIDRNKGSIVMRFLAKAQEAGHIDTVDYRQGWHVYHVSSRSIYRLLGDPESQLRRIKGDTEIRARLMTLDYVLEHEDDHFFVSSAEKARFFIETRRIPPDLFEDQLVSMLAALPVSLAGRAHPAQSPVRFAFIDEGLSDQEKFLRFLSLAEPLLRMLCSFEVVYVSCSESSFAAAKTAFWDVLTNTPSPNPGLFELNVRPVAQHRTQLQPRFTTLLLEYSYPKLRRSEAKSSERVRIR